MERSSLSLKMSDAAGHDYYGGDQGWYSSNTRAMAGCGSVAAANSLRALCRRDKKAYHAVRSNKRMPLEVRRALLSPKCDKEDFLMLMTGIYETMRSFEIFPLNMIYDRCHRNAKFFKYVKANTGRGSIGFISGVLRFAKKIGLILKCDSLSTAFCDKKTALDFIREGINKTGSVVILTSYNKHSLKTYPASAMTRMSPDMQAPFVPSSSYGTACMKCHFATITGINGDDLIISTWGRVATADVDELIASWHSIKAWESTLFYFSPCDRVTGRRSILTSWVPFVKGILQAIIRRFI